MLKKMCDAIMAELTKIADRGLSTANLETAYKLVDMLKDIKTVEAMEGGDYEPSRYSNGQGRYMEEQKYDSDRYNNGRYSNSYDTDDGNGREYGVRRYNR